MIKKLFISFILISSSLVLFLLFSLTTDIWWSMPSGPSLAQATLSSKPLEVTSKEEETVAEEEPAYTLDNGIVQKRSNTYDTLREFGLSDETIHEIVNSAEEVYDLANIKAGTEISVKSWQQDAVPFEVTVVLSPIESVVVEKKGTEWVARIAKKKVKIEKAAFSGEVVSSLWESVTNAGLDARTIYKLTDIFGWQIDFARQVKPQDKWRLIVERLIVDGKTLEWGSILAAEYICEGDVYSAFRFPNTGEEGEYYDAKGESLRGRFLKSPLRYQRISSKFQKKRFHPILGINRPHNGVDYAAPRGTPIRTVGDGTILAIGAHGPSGNMIKIKHKGKYQTAYKHLQGFAKGLRRGNEVKQGQIIGYVGATGLASGPHLHFEFYENNRFVDPLGKKFPREDSISKSAMKDFQKIVEKMTAYLPPYSLENIGRVEGTPTKSTM